MYIQLYKETKLNCW